jgi:hypothetical protein
MEVSVARAKRKLNDREVLALINHYGSLLGIAQSGLGGATRSDVIAWGERIVELAKTMRRKGSDCLNDDRD